MNPPSLYHIYVDCKREKLFLLEQLRRYINRRIPGSFRTQMFAAPLVSARSLLTDRTPPPICGPLPPHSWTKFLIIAYLSHVDSGVKCWEFFFPIRIFSC